MAAHCPLIAFLCLAGALLPAGAVLGNDPGCPEDWSPFETRCFKFFSAKTTWPNAEKSCHSHGANLASVHSADENKFIADLIQEAAGDNRRTWLGGHDAVQEGLWMWTDGSNWDYTSWPSAGQPDNAGRREHCVEINHGGHGVWNDIPSTILMEYVCAKDVSSNDESGSIILNGLVCKCTPK